MAYLGGEFDADSVEPSVPLETLPPGKYPVQIIESILKETQKGGQMLQLTLEIIEGPSKGRRLWDNLNLVNANPKAQEIAQRTLSAICHALNKRKVTDTEELHFLPMMATVEVEVDNRDKDLEPHEQRKRNAVKGYSAFDGGAPRSSGAPFGNNRPSTAPAAASTSRPAASSPPWKR